MKKFNLEELEKTPFSIMGSPWKFVLSTQTEDETLDGEVAYCDWSERKIVFDKELIVRGMDEVEVTKEVIRHELTHAYLDECGLGDEANGCKCWARNEEMIDWIAKIGPRLFATWDELNVK